LIALSVNIILILYNSSPAALALEDQGAIFFHGDLDNLPAIEIAIAGVSAVFCSTSTLPRIELDVQESHTKNIAGAAQDVGT
jgi:hypothetical protein